MEVKEERFDDAEEQLCAADTAQKPFDDNQSATNNFGRKEALPNISMSSFFSCRGLKFKDISRAIQYSENGNRTDPLDASDEFLRYVANRLRVQGHRRRKLETLIRRQIVEFEKNPGSDSDLHSDST